MRNISFSSLSKDGDWNSAQLQVFSSFLASVLQHKPATATASSAGRTLHQWNRIIILSSSASASIRALDRLYAKTTHLSKGHPSLQSAISLSILSFEEGCMINLRSSQGCSQVRHLNSLALSEEAGSLDWADGYCACAQFMSMIKL